jgi:hypothetical protein
MYDKISLALDESLNPILQGSAAAFAPGRARE